MAKYVALVHDTKYPHGYIRWLEASRIDAINRAIMATGKAWPDLELPTKIKHGYYFRARFDGMEISIWKER